MGILKRIKNIVVADVHQTLDKIEKPVKHVEAISSRNRTANYEG